MSMFPTKDDLIEGAHFGLELCELRVKSLEACIRELEACKPDSTKEEGPCGVCIKCLKAALSHQRICTDNNGHGMRILEARVKEAEEERGKACNLLAQNTRILSNENAKLKRVVEIARKIHLRIEMESWPPDTSDGAQKTRWDLAEAIRELDGKEIR